jgi:hypothetical protein
MVARLIVFRSSSLHWSSRAAFVLVYTGPQASSPLRFAPGATGLVTSQAPLLWIDYDSKAHVSYQVVILVIRQHLSR